MIQSLLRRQFMQEYLENDLGRKLNCHPYYSLRRNGISNNIPLDPSDFRFLHKSPYRGLNILRTRFSILFQHFIHKNLHESLYLSVFPISLARHRMSLNAILNNNIRCSLFRLPILLRPTLVHHYLPFPALQIIILFLLMWYLDIDKSNSRRRK